MKEELNMAFYLAANSHKIGGAWSDNDIKFICDSIENMINEKIESFKKDLIDILSQDLNKI